MVELFFVKLQLQQTGFTQHSLCNTVCNAKLTTEVSWNCFTECRMQCSGQDTLCQHPILFWNVTASCNILAKGLQARIWFERNWSSWGMKTKYHYIYIIWFKYKASSYISHCFPFLPWPSSETLPQCFVYPSRWGYSGQSLSLISLLHAPILNLSFPHPGS